MSLQYMTLAAPDIYREQKKKIRSLILIMYKNQLKMDQKSKREASNYKLATRKGSSASRHHCKLCLFCLFLDRSHTLQATKSELDKWYSMKSTSLCKSNNIMSRVKRQLTRAEENLCKLII